MVSDLQLGGCRSEIESEGCTSDEFPRGHSEPLPKCGALSSVPGLQEDSDIVVDLADLGEPLASQVRGCIVHDDDLFLEVDILNPLYDLPNRGLVRCRPE